MKAPYTSFLRNGFAVLTAQSTFTKVSAVLSVKPRIPPPPIYNHTITMNVRQSLQLNEFSVGKTTCGNTCV